MLLALTLPALLVRSAISKVGAAGMSWPSSASQSSAAAPASTPAASRSLAPRAPACSTGCGRVGLG